LTTWLVLLQSEFCSVEGRIQMLKTHGYDYLSPIYY